MQVDGLEFDFNFDVSGSETIDILNAMTCAEKAKSGSTV